MAFCKVPKKACKCRPKTDLNFKETLLSHLKRLTDEPQARRNAPSVPLSLHERFLRMGVPLAGSLVNHFGSGLGSAYSHEAPKPGGGSH